MAPLSFIGALSALPFAFAHMQISSPSPLRDPHADRPGEPKDYNILSPLNADGSNFACKGYHLNTPLTTVATYEAGSTQTLELRGSATHGGGSCQISLSCNGGKDFNVIKSIMGGCPLKNSYDFKIPSDIPAAKQCLLAWTWFNKIGNREMYMNCAVVDITNKRKSKRDTQVSAASALSRYPELFVANLANINSCRIQETVDVIFDNPGKSVDYGNGDNASMKPSFKRGECTGKPSKNAGSKDTSSGNSGGGGSGQWSAPAQAPSSGSNSNSDSNGCAAKLASGQWHPECLGGNPSSNQQEQKPTQEQKPKEQQPQKRPQKPQQSESQPKRTRKRPSEKKPNTKVQQELDAYLATLYGRDLDRRSVLTDGYPDAEHSADYAEHPAAPYKHVHDKHCKHKASGYQSDPYYNNDVYSGDATEDPDKYSHSQEHSDYLYKRVARKRRWTSYSKRDDVPIPARVPKKYYRGPASEYVQQAPNAPTTDASPNQVAAVVAVSNLVSSDTSAQSSQGVSSQSTSPASNQEQDSNLKQSASDTTAQGNTSSEAQPTNETLAYKAWSEMSEAEKFDAFLRRMVELSNNMYSLVKYASASTVNLPWYPPASTYDRNPASTDVSAQQPATVHRLARRGLASRSPAQVYAYPGPSIGSISAPGDATDADEGFQKWFPHLVQGLVTKRQLVDPVTSEASAEAGDSVNFFDALLAGFWKLIGDPFSYYGDSDSTDSDLDSAPDVSDIPILLGEPVNDGVPFPDFSIPDLDDATIIVTIEPLPTDADSFPGIDSSLPTLSPCIEPIPQVGFNSCLGGCNHTAAEIADHETYLEEFAKEQEAYEECLQAQGPPRHGSYWHDDDDDDISESVWQGEWNSDDKAEDASHRRPRPGWSQPLIPAPEVTTLPSSDSTDATLSDSAAESNDTQAEYMPYQNKTLGELVNEILDDPSVLAPPESSPDAPDSDTDDSEEASNPLQQAADQAEEGITVPQEPVEIDPSKIDSVADAFPWLLAPGPVVDASVPAVETGSA